MNYLDKLKDIKPIVEVNDNSFYLFLLVLLLCLVGILFFIWIGYKWYKKKKRDIYQFNLNNSKETAYQLIKIIRDKEGSGEYIDKLHNYTYKKEVPPFDKELFEEIVDKYKLKVELFK